MKIDYDQASYRSKVVCIGMLMAVDHSTLGLPTKAAGCRVDEK